MTSPIWREDPGLTGRFHPECPDDLEVIVHDGEPRRTGCKPELCWVRVTAAEPSFSRPAIYLPESTQLPQKEFDARYNTPSPVYVGQLLNMPHALSSVKQGDLLRFLVVSGMQYPLHVTSDYLRERPLWGVIPCNKCGASECFDPPTVMYRTRFPAMSPGEVPVQFTAFCTLCGGVQMLSNLTHDEDEGPALPPEPAKKPWWKLW